MSVDISKSSYQGFLNRENCVDEMGTCERQRCECDRALAEKLAQHEPEWNQFGFYFIIIDSKFKGQAEFQKVLGNFFEEIFSTVEL